MENKKLNNILDMREIYNNYETYYCKDVKTDFQNLDEQAKEDFIIHFCNEQEKEDIVLMIKRLLL